MKNGVWVIWIGGSLAMVFGASGSWVVIAAHLVVWLTLAAHLVEYFVKRPLFERSEGSLGHHFLETMIYGFFHWKPLEDKVSRERPS